MAKDRSSSKPPPRSQIVAFRYNGFDVMRDESMLVNLTGMWKAAESPPNKSPKQWRRKDGASFIEHTTSRLKVPVGHLLRTERGRNGSTFAHWQIALAYAKYLSDEFHSFVNEAFREWSEEKADPLLKVERGAQAAAAAGLSDEAEATVARVVQEYAAKLAAAQAEAKAELERHVGRLTGQIDDTRRDLALAHTANEALLARVETAEAIAADAAAVGEVQQLEIDTMQGDLRREIDLLKRATNLSVKDMPAGFWPLSKYAEDRGISLNSQTKNREADVCLKIGKLLGLPPVHYRPSPDALKVNLYADEVLKHWHAGYLRRNKHLRPDANTFDFQDQPEA